MNQPVSLPDVTVVLVDTKNYGLAINAIQKTLKQIKPARTVFFTNIDLDIPDVDIVKIDTLYSKKAYSDWMMKELGKQDIRTSNILIIQHDGYVLDGSQWDDEFLKYDYIGAPWFETDGHNVGNGGMSLRSFHLHKSMAYDENIIGIQPEDTGICRIYRNYLEQKYGINFAPEDLAHKFSYECHEPKDHTFGFHGAFHPPYSEPIVIKRTGAMGDVIQTEPVLEYFHKKGHPVYLDTHPGFYQLFANHYFPVKSYAAFDKTVIRHRIINLDMAYEVFPQMNHLMAYVKFCGIKDFKVRRPKLFYQMHDGVRLFKKYAVIHIDERETPHRNVYGVNWRAVRHDLELRDFVVIQIGKNTAQQAGIRFNTINEAFLKWVIAGCELFIGVDSGPSHIAVSLGIRSVIFFGSVNPQMIHVDMTKIEAIQSSCPIDKDHCWHAAPSTRGQDCEVDKMMPPCTMIQTETVLEAISNVMSK